MATTTDRAAEIRADLKRMGFSSRDVSVRAESFSMGSAIRVCIRNPRVPMSLVKAIAERHEDISRDQFGEILSGGNRFVTFSYDAVTRQALAAPYLAAVESALSQLAEGDDRSLADVPGVPNAMVGRHNGHLESLWIAGQGFHSSPGSAQGIAFAIGEMMANQ